MKDGQENIYYLLAPSLAAAKPARTWRRSEEGHRGPAAGGRGSITGWSTSLREFDGKQLQSVAQGSGDLSELEDEARSAGQGAGEHRVRRPGRPG